MSISYKEPEVDTNGASEVNLRTSSGVELLGQQVSATSLPVVIASNQSMLPTQTWGPNSHYTRISTNTTTTIKSGAGFLRRVIKMSGGIVILYDNTVGSGTIIQVIAGTNPTGTIVYDLPFTTGLTVVSTNGPDAIFVWD